MPRYQNILVAEDNPINCKLIQEILDRLELNCTIAKNGNEVLKLIEKQDFDCILMDCQMPELDGFQSTREIRIRELADSEHSKHTRIIAMTANALVGDRERCLDAGMDDYMAKPIRLTEVRDKLLTTDDTATYSEASNPATSESSSPIYSTLSSLMDELGKEPVCELAREFLDDGPAQLEKFTELNSASDIKGLRLKAHSFKSVCQFYGLQNTANSAQAIENVAKAAPSTDFSPLLASLFSAYETESARLIEALLLTRDGTGLESRGEAISCLANSPIDIVQRSAFGEMK